ncbi:dual specificity phosphatase [Mycena maculata]|uniref:Dual specificity phosphatase n=1 Tax=Mycena maculata TaxID=230809 RepID=A0AAD7H9K5_9AGAR|nr:dual specificity phosphatase [Mycena maculata]
MPKKSGDAAVLILALHLYLGPRTSASSAFISTHAITDILSIGSTPPTTVSGVTYHRLALADDVGASLDTVSAANAIITSVAQTQAQRILVHCSAAVSRSPTIVAAYLMSKHDMSSRSALHIIVTARPAVCPNADFVAQLKSLENVLRGECSLDMDVLSAKKTDRVAG